MHYQSNCHYYYYCYLVMARYSHKGHDSIRYDITQNIAIRYDLKVLHHM